MVAFNISIEGTKAYAEMLELIRDIHRHPETTDTMKTYIKLRMKQIISREDLTDWLEGDD